MLLLVTQMINVVCWMCSEAKPNPRRRRGGKGTLFSAQKHSWLHPVSLEALEKREGEKKRPRLEELVRFVRRNRSIKQSESFFL